jgi:hypothetical protein
MKVKHIINERQPIWSREKRRWLQLSLIGNGERIRALSLIVPDCSKGTCPVVDTTGHVFFCERDLK